MCQTVNTFFDKNYCTFKRYNSYEYIKSSARLNSLFLFVRRFHAGPWVSCGEWCLTKTSGFCPQIHATSRRNGTDIQLENCTRITTTTCPEVRIAFLFRLYCFVCHRKMLKSKVKCAQSARSARMI